MLGVLVVGTAWWQSIEQQIALPGRADELGALRMI
jgi:hypothetical protein